MEEMSNLLMEMRGEEMSPEPMVDPKTQRMTNIWHRIANDPMIQRTFKYKLSSLMCPITAKYLILIAMPYFNQNSLLLEIDPGWALSKYFAKIFGAGNFCIVPCILGHSGNNFQPIPKPEEFAASMRYIKEIINIVSPQCIFAIDAFPAEALRCDMNIKPLYGTQNPNPDTKNIPQLAKALDYGVVMKTTLGATGSYRYVILPRFSQKKLFKASIMANIDAYEKLQRFEYKDTPLCVFDPGYDFPKVYLDKYVVAERMVDDMLTDARYDSRGLRPNILNASQEELRCEYMYLTSLKYDHNYHMMQCFFVTPHGSSHLMRVTDIPMSFGFTPHAAFSMSESDSTGGVFAGMAENITPSDLEPLHRYLCSKLKWVFAYKKRDISEDIQLGITDCHIHGESRYYVLRKVITCKVSRFDMIKPVTQQLQRLIKAWKVETNQKFIPLETFSAEQIFSYTHTFKVCHWYKISGFEKLDHTYKKSSHRDHVRQTTSIVKFDECEKPFECIPPDSNIPVGNGRTSSSLPPHVQISMDIECVGTKGHFPDPWKNPIISICNTVWRKENVGVETDKEHMPKNGYLYVTFNLGYALEKKHQAIIDDHGETINHYFTNECELIMAYAWWVHYMMPDYYMGHNFKAFDINYIVQRATVLRLNLPPLGRVDDEVLRVDKHKMSTRAFGDRYITNIKMSGCCLLDFLEILLRDFKFESNTLNFVAHEILGGAKLEMPYAALEGKWTNVETFEEIIKYCLVDAQLVDRLINIKMCINNAMALSKVTGTVTPAQLWELGMQIKVFSAVMHNTKDRPARYKVMFPTFDGWSYEHNDIIVEKHMAKQGNFEGQHEHDESEPSDDTVVFSAASTSSAAKTTKPPAPNRKRAERPAPSTTSIMGNFLNKDGDGDKKEFDEEFARSAKRTLSVKVRQGVLNFGAAVSDDIDEKEYDTRVKKMVSDSKKSLASPVFFSSSSSSSSSSASSSSTFCDDDDEKLDYQKILREIKLNGGKETISKSSVIEDTYTGAVVIDAPLGMYFERPNMCLDFEGLYPSIMIAHNMGGDTLIFESERVAQGLSLDQVHTPPDCTYRNPLTGKMEVFHFVKKEIWPSVISETEIFLKQARGEAKKKVADAFKAGDVNLGNIYNALQNSFKLIMNSIYGALGVSKGPIAWKAIAKAVTAWGRKWIMEVKKVAEELFGAIVAGGDTDSVFINCPGIFVDGKLRHHIRNREEAELFGPWFVNTVLNPMLPKPMALAYEKLMYFLLTVARKRYNFIYAEIKKAMYIAAKGMETVRRDATRFTKATLKTMQNMLLVLPGEDAFKLLYPKPCKANPHTYYTRYEHYIYTASGLKFDPPADYVMTPLNDEHAAEMQKWTEMDPNAQRRWLNTLKVKWVNDEKRYFEIQTQHILDNKTKMVDYVRSRAKMLINGEVPLTECIQSKQRSKESYKNDRLPHLTVIKYKEERGEEVPQLGERVKFAYRSLPMAPDGKGRLKPRKAYECAEDPIKIIEENEPVDWLYYFSNTFEKPIVRYMRWVFKDEMVERVRNKAMRAASNIRSFFTPINKTLTGDAPAKLSSGAAGETSMTAKEKDITLGQITAETSQFLFMTPAKGSMGFNDLTIRYNKLLNRKRQAIKYEDTKMSPIAIYRDRKDEAVKKVFESHGVAWSCSVLGTEKDIEDICKLSDDIDALKLRHTEEFDRCMKTCMDCLGTKEVLCENIDCKELLPRLHAKAKLNRTSAEQDTIAQFKRSHLQHFPHQQSLFSSSSSFFS